MSLSSTFNRREFLTRGAALAGGTALFTALGRGAPGGGPVIPPNHTDVPSAGKLALKSPFDWTLSPLTGWTRRHWEETYFFLMKGIVDSSSPGGARQRIPGPRSHHGQAADELEGFTRSMIMSGPWLHGSKTGAYSWEGSAVDVAGFYRKGILAGTDPKHPEYWGEITDYAQQLAEMAALSWGLYLSKRLVWDRFSSAEQKQVADYLFQCTKVKYNANNWLLFNVVTNAALKRLGMPYSQAQIDANLQACDKMYVGEGWYRDGDINRIDYYNAWGFLYYHLIWSVLDGDTKPDLAETHRERTRLFARQLRYFFSGDGSVPCFGRSMTYRFGLLGPIALGQYLGCLDLPTGEARTLCNGVTKFFFSNEILTEQKHLSLGFLRPCAEMLEHYSCGGSPYWAAKAYHLLLIQPDDPFWQAKEEKLPIHRESYSMPLRSPGFLLVGDHQSGHVQLINQKSYHDLPEYNAKYTKFAYSSIFSFEPRAIYQNFNCDNVLQFSADGINFRQRWEMTPLYCENGFAASRYPLYDVDQDGTVHTSILVKDDFMINFHRVETKKRGLVFKEGGYPLGYDEGAAETVSVPGAEAAYKDGKLTFIRNLYGYTAQFHARPFAGDVGGSNVRYYRSVVPALGFENGSLEEFYLASLVCARVGADPVEQLAGLVKRFTLAGNAAEIVFYDDERAFIQIHDIHDVSLSLNGRPFSGPIVMARISADGKKWFVLESSGQTQSEGG